jgi:hypothetical protein
MRVYSADKGASLCQKGRTSTRPHRAAKTRSGRKLTTCVSDALGTIGAQRISTSALAAAGTYSPAPSVGTRGRPASRRIRIKRDIGTPGRRSPPQVLAALYGHAARSE